MEQIDFVLKFLNIFLTGNKLTNIDNINSFVVNKSLLINKNNVSLFSVDQIDEMSAKFLEFRTLYNENVNNAAFMIVAINYLIQSLNDSKNFYKFVTNKIIHTNETNCTIDHKIIKSKIHDICACLRDSNVRKDARKFDATISCICGLFSYRDKPIITHTSFGINKLKGGFEFVDPNVLYNFIINSEHKTKYLFAENRTKTTQAYFDIDFKSKNCDKEFTFEIVELMTQHIIENICKVLKNQNYIYVDKTFGYGVHLYFPEIICTKKQLIEYTQNIINKMITENILKLTDDKINTYKYILDICACNNGFILLFQDKNGTHYKINKEKSQYTNIPDDPTEQLKLCSLRIQ